VKAEKIHLCSHRAIISAKANSEAVTRNFKIVEFGSPYPSLYVFGTACRACSRKYFAKSKTFWLYAPVFISHIFCTQDEHTMHRSFFDDFPRVTWNKLRKIYFWLVQLFERAKCP